MKTNNEEAIITAPSIVDNEAYTIFINKVVAGGLNPNDPWVKDYVSISWKTTRPYFVEKRLPIPGSKVLEFGCNMGASSIMLAALGGEVTAIDINADYVDIAQANARAHGVGDKIVFTHVADTRKLPFPDNAFDLIVCNSVLEYVHTDHYEDVAAEIDRVLKPGGVLYVLGTSSKLWPQEVHCKAWFVNYLPRILDPLIEKIVPDLMRGLSPFRLRHSFKNYENLDRTDNGASILAAKLRTTPSWKYNILKLFNRFALSVNTSLGLLLPSITVALKKQ